MKISVKVAVLVTTAVLVLLTVMSQFNILYSILFFGTLIGQGLLIYLVFKVLRDDYSTDKTFEDWYEDVPLETLE